MRTSTTPATTNSTMTDKDVRGTHFGRAPVIENHEDGDEDDLDIPDDDTVRTVDTIISSSSSSAGSSASSSATAATTPTAILHNNRPTTTKRTETQEHNVGATSSNRRTSRWTIKRRSRQVGTRRASALSRILNSRSRPTPAISVDEEKSAWGDAGVTVITAPVVAAAAGTAGSTTEDENEKNDTANNSKSVMTYRDDTTPEVPVVAVHDNVVIVNNEEDETGRPPSNKTASSPSTLTNLNPLCLAEDSKSADILDDESTWKITNTHTNNNDYDSLFDSVFDSVTTEERRISKGKIDSCDLLIEPAMMDKVGLPDRHHEEQQNDLILCAGAVMDTMYHCTTSRSQDYLCNTFCVINEMNNMNMHNKW